MSNQNSDNTVTPHDRDAVRSALLKLRQQDALRTQAVMQRISAQPVPHGRAPIRVSWLRNRAVLAAAAGVAVAVSAGVLASLYRTSAPVAPVTSPLHVAAVLPPAVPGQPAPALESLSATLSSAEPGAIVALPGGTFEGSIRITKAVTLHATGGRVQIGARAGGQ